MDYIREELLRQRAAWAALLLGQPLQETEGAERKVRAGIAEEDDMAGGGLKSVAVWGQSIRLRDSRAAQRQTVTIGQASLREARGGLHGTSAPQDGGMAYEMGNLREQRYAAGDLPPGQEGAQERVEMTILRPGKEGAQEAKRLSRIYQQDARRYDGGFTLY